MYRPLIFPTQCLYHGTAIIPTTSAGQGTHTHSILAREPELEPDLTPDETIGFLDDGPPKPLPRHEVIRNLAALRASDDPALQDKGTSFTERDYDRAVAEYAAWEIRQ